MPALWLATDDGSCTKSPEHCDEGGLTHGSDCWLHAS